jgi:light-regulated signal transduction histidine kinase (bacteriophytochrome)
LKSTAPDEPASSALTAVFEQRLADCALQSEATARELVAFGASLSHDLRAPLRSIEGFSRLLLQPPHLDQLDETGQDYLKRIHRASLHLSQMMDEMLQLVRLAQTGVKSETVNLTGMAHDILEGLKQAAPPRSTEIVVDPEMVLTGDSRLLRLVLENLLGNAWKFSGKNEVVRIFLGRVSDEGVSAICVRDHGVGFEQRYADRLFRAFSRLHTDPQFAGLGTGLAKAQRAIHAQGGRIWARAQADAGAAFYFTLPGLPPAPGGASDRHHGEK